MPIGAIAGGAIGGIGSLVGGGKASSASKEASKMQQEQANMTRAQLAPYVAAGYGALPAMSALAASGPFGGMPDYLTQAAGMLPPQMTQAQLEATPGYQFTRDQGLKAVQSAAAARGLGVSGSALKGAASFATELANKTYKDQFEIAQQRFKDVLGMSEEERGILGGYNTRLQNVASLGESAGANTGTITAQSIGNAGNFLSSAGMREGSSLVNAGNALNQGIQGYLGYNQLQNLMGQNAAQNPLTTAPGSSYSGAGPSGNTWYW